MKQYSSYVEWRFYDNSFELSWKYEDIHGFVTQLWGTESDMY